MIVNGREYPLWSQFIEGKKQFIGKTLVDKEISEYSTEVVDITLEPNGETSAFFSIVGKDFSCGFDVRFGGINSNGDGLISFSGYGSQEFYIK